MSSSSGTSVGIVSDLWCYPVKSFRGQRDRRAFLSPFGFLGDRRCAVLAVSDWQPLTARRVPMLLGYGATFINGERGEDVAVQMPGGHTVRWDDPALATEIGEFLERDVRLVQSATGIHDAAPVHVITEASVQQMADWMLDDVDRRRFRANVIVETDDGRPFVEADWPGHRIALGHEAIVDVLVGTERCAITTYDPDTLDRNTEVVVAIARERENMFGVYCRVVRGGWVQVGDRVTIGRVPVRASA